MEAAEAAEANFVLQAMESIKQRARWTAGLDGPSGRYISDMGGREWNVQTTWIGGRERLIFYLRLYFTARLPRSVSFAADLNMVV